MSEPLLLVPPCEFQSQAPPKNVFTSPVMTIEAGPSDGPTKTFPIRRGLICYHSKFFDNLLQGNFREGGSDHHRLSEEYDLDVFEIVFYWLNTGKLFEGQTSFTKIDEIPLSYFHIAQVYVFADAHEMPRLKNAAIDLLAAKIAAAGEDYYEHPHGEYVNYIFDNTKEHDPARKLLIYEFVECIDLYGDIISMELPDELLKEGMIQIWMNDPLHGRQFLDRKEWYQELEPGICWFHDHPGGASLDRGYFESFLEDMY